MSDVKSCNTDFIMDKKYKHKVNFRLEQRKAKKGETPREVPILADITFSRKRIWYHTGYRIAPSKWDEKVQRVKRNNANEDGASASEINQRLVKLEAAVDEVFSQLELQQDEATPISVREELKKVLNEEKSTRLTVTEVYQIYIDEHEKEMRESPDTATWRKGTLTKHKTMLRHLQGFSSGIYFEDIDDEFLSKFELHLIGKGLSNNYTHKSMKDIKSFLNWAFKKGYNRNNTYQSFSPRFRDETKNDDTINLYALTDEEIEAIMTFPTKREAIDRARDIFIFACFTGMRFSEVISLRWSNIFGDIVDIIAPKTNKRQRFALPLEAQRIIGKYPRDPKVEDPYVFPHISNQKYNKHLKDVGRLAGMTGDWIQEKQNGRNKTRITRPKYELLTSHVARRTFVTMCLRRGMSGEDIRAVTGHSTAAMMGKYVKMDDDSKREKMNILNGEEVHQQQTVFDLGITDQERIAMGLPAEETYFEMFEGDTVSANAHLAVLCHLRGDRERRVDFLKRLPTDRFNEVLDFMLTTFPQK